MTYLRSLLWSFSGKRQLVDPIFWMKAHDSQTISATKDKRRYEGAKKELNVYKVLVKWS